MLLACTKRIGITAARTRPFEHFPRGDMTTGGCSTGWALVAKGSTATDSETARRAMEDFLEAAATVRRLSFLANPMLQRAKPCPHFIS